MDNITKYVLTGTGIIIMIFIYAKYMEIKSKNAFLKKMKRQWGHEPEREYTDEALKTVSGYFEYQKDKEDFYIDDITWNDLDMDMIYKQINNCNSSLGDEYLYYMLRTPLMEEEELLKRSRLADFMENNEDLRLSLQLMFAKAGRLRGFSINRYIHLLGELKREKNIKHYAMAVLAMASIAMMLINPQFGIIMLIISAIVNITQYMKRKGETEPYFMSVLYIISILRLAADFIKPEADILKEYQDRVYEIRKVFKKFENKSKWLKIGNNAGSIADALMDYIRMFFHIDLIMFNQMLDLFEKNANKLDELFEILGSVEASISIANYRQCLNAWTYPTLYKKDKAYIKAQSIYHPIIKNPVKNNINEERCVLITGSNASGKSTFLKTIAINSILAQTIFTVSADYYEGVYVRTYSSMALSDSIINNESYYIAEIKSLKRIMDAAKEQKNGTVLCFVDEVLRGTNTIERIAASAQILKKLNEEGVFAFAATHDIELTHILEDLYANYHFTEEVSDEDILFNYKLENGRSVTKNAIRLLDIMGYDKSVTEMARECAKEFEMTNTWRKI